MSQAVCELIPRAAKRNRRRRRSSNGTQIDSVEANLNTPFEVRNPLPINQLEQNIQSPENPLIATSRFCFSNADLMERHRNVSLEFKAFLESAVWITNEMSSDSSFDFDDKFSGSALLSTYQSRKAVNTSYNFQPTYNHVNNTSPALPAQARCPNVTRPNTTKCSRPDSRDFTEGLSFEIFGSTVTNLVLPGKSDVDINVSLDDGAKLGFGNKQRAFEFVKEKIMNHPQIEIVDLRPFARVPVIKVLYHTEASFTDPTAQLATIQGDITFGHSIPRYNSKLLRVYGQMDPLVRRLMLLTKLWAASRSIKDASQGYLSSYSFMLLVTFYAQKRMALPVIQKGDPKTMEKFGIDSIDKIARRITLDDPSKSIEVHDFPDLLTDSGEDEFVEYLSASAHCMLFWGFLEFLASLPFHQYYVSVRTGELIPRTDSLEDRWRWSIEDPFEHFKSDAPRDLGCVLREGPLHELRSEISRGMALLRRWNCENRHLSCISQFEDVNATRESEAAKLLEFLLSPTSSDTNHRRQSLTSKPRSAPCIAKPSARPLIDVPSQIGSKQEESDISESTKDIRFNWMFRGVANQSSSSVLSDVSDVRSAPISDRFHPSELVSDLSDDLAHYSPNGRMGSRFIGTASTSRIAGIKNTITRVEPAQQSTTNVARSVLMQALGVV